MTKGQNDMPTAALKAVEPPMPTRQDAGAIMEQVIAKGDLKDLKPEERARYYLETCRSLGINPLVKPFEYITLNGKLTLYATRTATDQLRETRGVSIEITSREPVGDLYVVTAKARNAIGRTDESIGAVNIKGLQGDNLANAYMKAETKAKRRVTLSICGLGWMDETEVSTVPNARIVESRDDGTVVDIETGEVTAEPEQPKAEFIRAPTIDADAARMRRLHAVAAEKGLNHDEVHSIVVGRGKASLKDLTPQELDKLTNWMERQEPPAIQAAIDAGRDPATLGAK